MRQDHPVRSPGITRRHFGALLAALAMIAGGCAVSSSTDHTGVTVIATTTVWADVAAHVVGDDGTVTALMPVGADPHGFQASSSQVAAMISADLVVSNGLGLELGLLDVLEMAQGDGANVLEVGLAADPLGLTEERETCEPLSASTDADEMFSCDPHVWMDPDRVALVATAIADALEEIDDSVNWHARASAYAEELQAAAQVIEDTLAPIPEANRKLVTNHDSFGYFARRFELDVIETVIPSGASLADPSSGELARLVAAMRDAGVQVVFAETTNPTRLAQAVAAEVGDDVQVVELYTGSIGGPGSGADSLVGMLVTNAELIADALTP